MKLALVHDLAEALVGDITPHCAVTPEDKHRREREAMATLRDTLGHSTAVGGWMGGCVAGGLEDVWGTMLWWGKASRGRGALVQAPTAQRKQRDAWQWRVGWWVAWWCCIVVG